jgi:hypothetical protein
VPPIPAEGEQAIEISSFREWREFMNAKEMVMKRSALGKAFTIAALAAVALAVPAANASTKVCSLATLKGTFADKDTGFLIGVGPFAGVSLERFDGNGTLTGGGFGSLNGQIVQVTFVGTYTVNPDCTGTYTVDVSPLGLTTHASFVIADGGNELQIVITDPGTVITCFARRQFP